ncbi:hypothetical protein ACWD11_22795 [Streptomyces sp. NPDC002776]
MSATVTMTHPDLPSQPITVHAESVAHYQASGWQVADEARTTTPATTRRPRTTKGN